LAPALLAARDAAQRSQSMNNLKQISLAMLNYHDANGHYPPAVLFGPDGKTPHSWRVALLPYLENEARKSQYNFNEPWDSPNNLKVLDDMPSVYRHPKDGLESTNTSYFVMTGPETVFSGKDGTRISRITDGTSLTLLAVEAKRDIPWTKPEDIPYAADAPLPELGGWVQTYFNAAMCDGSAHTLPQDIHEKILRAKITKAGGEREANLVELVP
jgi:type II secretory pathway pseudopilin PulG